ncbi:MAG TPA: (Fe-S)-binding protein, partial [Coriobacteriia bacterium]|nr:(Fe-S)-binding protein [Coriobacteriia bacterium]
MALTGLQIYKLLPMTNCKECGFPTCLAFAMKLSQKGTELDKCPYVSDEAKTALDAASAPPIKLVAIGSGERAFEVGNEVVLFRHEKTFYHEPGLVVRV